MGFPRLKFTEDREGACSSSSSVRASYPLKFIPQIMTGSGHDGESFVQKSAKIAGVVSLYW